MWQQLLAHHHALMLIGLDPGLLSEIDPPNLADWSETVGLGRVGEFEIHALEDEQPAFQGGAIELL
jgi:hypothetical protein